MSLISQYPSKTFWCVNYAITVFGKILQTRKLGVGAWAGVGQQGGKVFAHTPLYERGLKRCWRRGRGEETIWGMSWGVNPPKSPKGATLLPHPQGVHPPSPRGATTPPFLKGATPPQTTSLPPSSPMLKRGSLYARHTGFPLFFWKKFYAEWSKVILWKFLIILISLLNISDNSVSIISILLIILR